MTILVTVISIVCPFFKIVVSLIGCLTISFVTFIFPPLIHYMLVPQSKWKQTVDIILACLGVCVMVIATEADCSLLMENYWVNITVNAGLCNTMHTDIAIEDNPFLTSITIHKNSLQYLASFTINNNTLLNSIVIEDGDNSSEGAMRNVQTVSITSISLPLSLFIRSSFSCYSCYWQICFL